MTTNTEKFLKNNTEYIKSIKESKEWKLDFAISPALRNAYRAFQKTYKADEKNAAAAEVIRIYRDSLILKLSIKRLHYIEDSRNRSNNKGKLKVIDKSNRREKDYYSVALIVKNEARYIKELVLFYKATGADRIYLYDNDSSDNLLEVLDPFINSGFVVYSLFSGEKAQLAAYRDAIRTTRHRTKWLALIDADEFLFSPKGNMKEQLVGYEDYPGIGVNWVMFGPNGHKSRPKGLLMDNYTEVFADYNCEVNHHIKSIVQPKKVFAMMTSHFALYKNNQPAVDENKKALTDRTAYVVGSGKAFSENNSIDVFRINHYYTKSLEDLREKCSRGYADGAPNLKYENALKGFDAPMTKDYSIKKYADIVREEYSKY